LETNAVKNTHVYGLSLTAAAVALGLFAATVSAQDKPVVKPAVPAAAPAAPAAAKPAATIAPASPVAAKPVEKKAAAPSPCKGLDEPACKGKADACGWIVPTKIDAKTGKPDKPYCRKIAGIAKKKVDTPANSTTKGSAPTPPTAPAKGSAPTPPPAPAAKK